MNDIVALHRAEYGREPEVTASAPGVAHLLGEHIEDAGFPTLSMATHMSVHVAMSRRKDLSLRFFAPDIGERRRTGVSSIKPRDEDRWANVPKGIIAFVLSRGHRMKGVDITIAGDIPRERGLGASSAVCVATALAMERLLDLPRGSIDPVAASAYAKSRYGRLPVSDSDATVSAFSRPGFPVLYRVGQRDFQELPGLDAPYQFVLTDSGLEPERLDEEERDVYGHVLQGCADGDDDDEAEEDEEHKSSPGPWTVSPTERRRVPISNSKDAKEEFSDTLELLDTMARRTCQHVMGELERIEHAVEALRSGDTAALGKTLFRSQESLRDLLEVSCPELDWLVKRAVEVPGVTGSRLSGPGLGGFTVTLLTPDSAADYGERLEEYERIFGFKPQQIVLREGPGATVHEKLKKE